MSTVTVHNFGREGYRSELAQTLDAIKELPSWAIGEFIVTLIKRAQEEPNFKDYPFPNYMAGELLLRHYNEGMQSKTNGPQT